MYPEVYVSRLPCTTVNEVRVVVNKVLNYESTGPDAKPWYKTFIGIGGKTFDIYEGNEIGEDKKSYAISFYLQDPKQTLTDSRIDVIMNKLIKTYKVELNAQIR